MVYILSYRPRQVWFRIDAGIFGFIWLFILPFMVATMIVWACAAAASVQASRQC